VVHDHPAARSFADNGRTAATGCRFRSPLQCHLSAVGSAVSSIDWFAPDSLGWVGGHRDTVPTCLPQSTGRHKLRVPPDVRRETRRVPRAPMALRRWRWTAPEGVCVSQTLQGWDEGTRYAGAVKLLIWPMRLFVSGNRQRMDVNCNLSYIQKANCFYLAVRISWIVRNARTNVCVRHA